MECQIEARETIPDGFKGGGVMGQVMSHINTGGEQCRGGGNKRFSGYGQRKNQK